MERFLRTLGSERWPAWLIAAVAGARVGRTLEEKLALAALFAMIAFLVAAVEQRQCPGPGPAISFLP